MSDNVVTCNECELDFKLPKPKRKVHQDLIYEFYFHCSYCNHKYISYYTNKKIRRDINRQKKRWQSYNKQMNIYDQLLAQVDSWNKDKNDYLSDKEMEVANKLQQSQDETRRIQAEIKMEDKLIKNDMDALMNRMTKDVV